MPLRTASVYDWIETKKKISRLDEYAFWKAAQAPKKEQSDQMQRQTRMDRNYLIQFLYNSAFLSCMGVTFLPFVDYIFTITSNQVIG